VRRGASLRGEHRAPSTWSGGPAAWHRRTSWNCCPSRSSASRSAACAPTRRDRCADALASHDVHSV